MKIINLTPHPVTVFSKNEVKRVFPSEGLARVNSYINHHEFICGVRINKIKQDGLTGLPEPEQDTYYIVSQIVKMWASYRNDLLVPDELCKNEQGLVIGCKALAL